MENLDELFISDDNKQLNSDTAIETPSVDLPFLPEVRAEELPQPIQDYALFEDRLRGCAKCELRPGCIQVVVGSGTTDTPLLFIGEGPGQDEDLEGIPFVGAAGQLLNKILEAAEIPRDKVYITNVVKCRPPHNRTPLPDEVKCCRINLEQQIRFIKPKIIVCLGSIAAQTVIDPNARITKIRGQWYHREGIMIMATFHPAALLRNQNYKRPAWEDFKMIRDAYKKIIDESN